MVMFNWSSRSSVKLALISRLSRRWRTLARSLASDIDASDGLAQARHAFADLVHIGRGERQAEGGVVGVGAEERRAGHKGHTLFNRALGQHIAVSHLAASTRQARPHKQAALGLHKLDGVPQLLAQRIAH